MSYLLNEVHEPGHGDKYDRLINATPEQRERLRELDRKREDRIKNESKYGKILRTQGLDAAITAMENDGRQPTVDQMRSGIASGEFKPRSQVDDYNAAIRRMDDLTSKIDADLLALKQGKSLGSSDQTPDQTPPATPPATPPKRRPIRTKEKKKDNTIVAAPQKDFDRGNVTGGNITTTGGNINSSQRMGDQIVNANPTINVNTGSGSAGGGGGIEANTIAQADTPAPKATQAQAQARPAFDDPQSRIKNIIKGRYK